MSITITREHDTTAELLADYRQDYDGGYDADRPARRYTAPTGTVGSITFLDTVILHTEEGERDGWRLFLWGGEYDITREGQYPLPDPDELAEMIAGIIQRAQPASQSTLAAELERLEELAGIIVSAQEEMRAVAVSAVTEHGGKKTGVAISARISRSTLDRWLDAE